MDFQNYYYRYYLKDVVIMHEVRHQATSNKKNGSTKTTAVHTGKRSQIKTRQDNNILSASYIARRQLLYRERQEATPFASGRRHRCGIKANNKKEKEGGGELKHKSRQLTEEEEEANVKRRKRKQPTNTDDENAQKKGVSG